MVETTVSNSVVNKTLANPYFTILTGVLLYKFIYFCSSL